MSYGNILFYLCPLLREHNWGVNQGLVVLRTLEAHISYGQFQLSQSRLGKAVCETVAWFKRLAVEARVQVLASLCGICGGQMPLGQVYTREFRVSSVSIILPVFHIHLFIHHRCCMISATN